MMRQIALACHDINMVKLLRGYDSSRGIFLIMLFSVLGVSPAYQNHNILLQNDVCTVQRIECGQVPKTNSLCYLLGHDNDNQLCAMPGNQQQHHALDPMFVVSLQNDISRTSSSRQVEDSKTTTTSSSSNVGTKLLWKDDLVNIWEFCLESGTSCPFHQHQYPYVFINLKVSWTLALDEHLHEMGEEPRRMQVQDQVTFVPRHLLGGHGVRNVGKDLFQQFIIEFKQC